MEQILHLFTPVSEKLPEDNTICIVCVFKKSEGKYQNDRYILTLAVLDGHTQCFNVNNVTHWLDLSKLTTKDRAEKLALNAYDHGLLVNKLETNKSIQNFINENKYML